MNENDIRIYGRSLSDAAVRMGARDKLACKCQAPSRPRGIYRVANGRDVISEWRSDANDAAIGCLAVMKTVALK